MMYARVDMVVFLLYVVVVSSVISQSYDLSAFQGFWVALGIGFGLVAVRHTHRKALVEEVENELSNN